VLLEVTAAGQEFAKLRLIQASDHDGELAVALFGAVADQEVVIELAIAGA